MSVYVLAGNFFSFLSVACVALSVVQNNKTDLIYWQIIGVVFSILSCIFLSAYAALIMNIVTLVRNVLAYFKKLTKNLTLAFCVVCAVIGIGINNLGIYGLLPIAATVSYTIFLFATKNEQQMRYAVIINLLLWCVHDFYIQAYPAAISDVIISLWSAMQIFKHHHFSAVKN